MYQRSFRTKREREAWQANDLSNRARGTLVDPRGELTPFSEWLISNPAKRPGSIARDEAVIRVHPEALRVRPCAVAGRRDLRSRSGR